MANRKSGNSENSEGQITRVKLPRGREVIGVIESRLGGNKMMVACLKENCGFAQMI